jgi:hypothetical protein
MSYCGACLRNQKSICYHRGHQLKLDNSFLLSKCQIAAYPEREKWCDAVDCGKRISALYFRGSATNPLQDSTYLLVTQIAVYATMTNLIFVCNALWVVVYVITRLMCFQRVWDQYRSSLFRGKTYHNRSSLPQIYRHNHKTICYQFVYFLIRRRIKYDPST